MVSDIIKIGTKIDIMSDSLMEKHNPDENAVYHSKVQDIFPNGDLEIDMPTVNGKLIMLSHGIRYRIVSYADKGTYVAVAKVVDRYKANNMYLLRIRFITQLEKFQRREYFRCECTLEMKYGVITENDVHKMDEQEKNSKLRYIDEPAVPFFNSVALDISGGGIRFVTKQQIQQESILFIKFSLNIDSNSREFRVVGKVLSSTQVENMNNRYENRVQFIRIKNEDRESIIRYIFEQERKVRKLAGGK